MAKKSVGDLAGADLKGKKVFVRADLNVPLDDNQNITDLSIPFAIADSCRKLASLQLESCSLISERSLKLLGLYCVLLEELDFTDCHGVNDTALKYLSRCSNLKCLKVGLCTEISDKGLFYIASNCSKIVELDLYRCPGIGDDGLAAISSGCKKLKSLNVSYCTRLTDRRIEYIGRLKELVDLDMRSLVGVHGAGLTVVAAGCEKLAELDLKHCKNIQDMAFCALAYYKNLRQAAASLSLLVVSSPYSPVGGLFSLLVVAGSLSLPPQFFFHVFLRIFSCWTTTKGKKISGIWALLQISSTFNY